MTHQKTINLYGMQMYITKNFPVGTIVVIERFHEPILEGVLESIHQDKVLVRPDPNKNKKHIRYEELVLITKT